MATPFWLPGEKVSEVETKIRDAITNRLSREDFYETKLSHYAISISWKPLISYPNNDRPANRLSQACTLAGYRNNVQAASPLEYMKQTWPDRGPEVYHFLAGAFSINNPSITPPTDSVGIKPSHYATLQAPDGSDIILDLTEHPGGPSQFIKTPSHH